ncbi:MAG TPA: efflux RND transporter periplasmic adaptor subunit [Candidatus Dormibacteraeota bacterium]|nr:efflux RND transporter periplasmic adaptor subunit [Candidatus Dormibacteraeota bacterium]
MSSNISTHDLSSLKIDDRARTSRGIGKKLGLFSAIIGAFVLLAAAVFAFRTQKPTVEIAVARGGNDAKASALLNASGYVTPRRRSTIAAKITGRVTGLFFDEGAHVKTGQILATLDDADTQVRLNSAKAERNATFATIEDLQVNLANAERELNRAQQLLDTGVGTSQTVDVARTAAASYRARIASAKEQVRSADAKISVAQQDVDNATIRAPYDGIVVSKDAMVGEMVSPVSAGGGFTRTGIATIVDMNSNEIEVDVNESYIARVLPKQKVTATLDAYPDWQIPCKVRTIIPTADRQKATVKVRISFDKLDPRILPDMGVKVAFLGEESPQKSAEVGPRALIPQRAVRDDNGQHIVLLVRDGKVERRAIRLGSHRGDDVEVTAGLDPGDSVVVQGPESLHEGQSVEIKK